jgi:hypothetical protein
MLLVAIRRRRNTRRRRRRRRWDTHVRMRMTRCKRIEPSSHMPMNRIEAHT